MKQEELREDWAGWREQLMVYFLFTYYCGAAYDEKPYLKASFAVVSSLLIEELFMAAWLCDGKSEVKKNLAGMFCQTAGAYSREVEHSEQNLNILEQAICGADFKLKKLMKLICS